MIVYTAVFGNYYKHLVPPPKIDQIEFICFSDRNYKNSGWKIYKIKPPYQDSRLSNRWIKINSHLINEENTIYIDGNHRVFHSPLSISFENSNFILHKHESRNCVYDEAKECIKQNKDKENVEKQIKHYKEEKMPRNFGLYGCSVLIRKNTEETKRINELWFEEVNKWSARDQISLPYVLWKNKANFTVLNECHINNSFSCRLTKAEMNMVKFL